MNSEFAFGYWLCNRCPNLHTRNLPPDGTAVSFMARSVWSARVFRRFLFVVGA